MAAICNNNSGSGWFGSEEKRISLNDPPGDGAGDGDGDRFFPPESYTSPQRITHQIKAPNKAITDA